MPSGDRLLYSPCHCKQTPIPTCLLPIVCAVICLNSIHFSPPPSLSLLRSRVDAALYSTTLLLFLPRLSLPVLVLFSNHLYKFTYLTWLPLNPSSLLLFFIPLSYSLLLSAGEHQCAVYRAGECPSRDTESCTTADLHCNIYYKSKYSENKKTACVRLIAG